MPPRLDDLFSAGVLVRPSTQHPNLVHLIRALASLAGVERIERAPPVQQIIDLIGPAEHYVFVLLDGLGMNILPLLPPDSFVRRNLKRTIHSTCPSTTACALTSIATADWPNRHGVTGWFTHLPEHELTSMILPFAERFSGTPLTKRGIKAEDVLPLPPILPQFTHRPLTLSPSYIANTTYNLYCRGGTPGLGYTSIENAVDQAIHRVRTSAESSQRTYTYLYLHDIDTLCHHVGVAHDAVAPLVVGIDAELNRLAESLGGLARVVVSADHGLIDVEKPNQTLLETSDPLVALLQVPPSGDARMPIFHVREGRQRDFQGQFNERFGDRMTLISVSEAEEYRLFGPGPLSPVARRRFGDFIGIAHRPATLGFHPPGKPIGNLYVAVHAGLSPEEMLVPLCVA
ncbi:MAG: hypothetical protein QOE14_1824 [Humisphaera sp.]|nr:hypothetical protein [Humisphaera sp.]